MHPADPTAVLAAETASNPLAVDPVEVVVGVVAFLLLFIVLRRTVFPRLERMYAERAERIDGGMRRAEETRRQAAALRQDYEAQHAALRAEAARIRDEARAEGQRVRAELRAAAEEEAERMRLRGVEQLDRAREQVRQELHPRLGEPATALAERILGGRLDPALQAAVVAEFLAALDDAAPETGETATRPG
jgi:F-type H+-transporting ATPase subunit b